MKWISVEDRLPEINSTTGKSNHVLVLTECKLVFYARLNSVRNRGAKTKWTSYCLTSDMKVKNWRPLPEQTLI